MRRQPGEDLPQEFSGGSDDSHNDRTGKGAPRDPVTGRFQNNVRVARHGGFLDWQRQRRRERLANRGQPPVPVPDFPRATPSPQIWQGAHGPLATWVGHATVLLQVNGITVITDPMFSPRASPLRFAGPRRRVPPVPPLADLPHVDVVLVSHNHYDHLDLRTLRALRRQAGGAPRFFVPLGLRKWLARRGIPNAVELDWWQHADAGRGLRVHLVPAQHWSRRGLRDMNKTLWGGWVAEWVDFRFLFTGDTGYNGADFRAIGAHFGGFDLAAIPIGAYEPRWFMKIHHVNPEEAVRILQDVRARQALAIHWGTFALTDEPLDEPPRALAIALAVAGVPHERFWVLRHGETRPIPARAAQP